MKKDKITIYTDGSSLGNPGPGGWGVLIQLKDKKIIELGGREEKTTNNRMELMAVIKAFKYLNDSRLGNNGLKLILDSEYVKKGITEWIYGWVQNNWRTKNRKPVLNQDLWKELIIIVQEYEKKNKIEWERIDSHTGVAGNERADQIAVSFAEDKPTPLKDER
ncbi:ribonuclease HI [Candidatus Nomurabacteria bacterium RIFCSPLOWO2_01_FULL_33_24]|uniref:Ribonuclease H n=1 Tax=Candidatus Nomurabacteria bacterium RIFCSPLOWO2_01_FULL_33_24 TaxID=1801765 RepID=A0A1F6X1Y0_9BACT|nr:MAG: ribonuclease HI [Candidatus Nomurabacteria bacterium RIFCSPLOWO2_01_FULL_33_24]